MKRFFLFVFVFLLCACQNPSLSDEQLKDQIALYAKDKSEHQTNINSKYFSYYLPSDMQRVESDGSSAVLSYDGNSILINLNLVDLLNTETSSLTVENGFYNAKNLVLKDEGFLYGFGGHNQKYHLEVYRENNDCLITLFTPYFRLYSYCEHQECAQMIRHMMILVKSAECNKELIQEDFSKEVVIDYTKKQINLFDITIPKNGYLGDMIVNEDGTIGVNDGSSAIQQEEPTEVPAEITEEE